MSGDPTNAALWTGADVLVAPLGSAVPATISDPFDGDWDQVGLLDGDAGFQHTRSQDKSDFFAWGQVLVRTSRKNFKLQVGMTLLEYNDVTKDIIWPGSTADALVVPVPEPMLMALQLTEGDRTRRLISAYQVEFDADSFTENESGLSNFPVMATVFPNGDGELWVPQDTNDNPPASLAISGSGSLGASAIGKLTATVTFADSSTADVSASAKWTTSNAAKCTVAYGYVSGVAAGAATITASWGGVSGTKAMTVS